MHSLPWKADLHRTHALGSLVSCWAGPVGSPDLRLVGGGQSGALSLPHAPPSPWFGLGLAVLVSNPHPQLPLVALPLGSGLTTPFPTALWAYWGGGILLPQHPP